MNRIIWTFLHRLLRPANTLVVMVRCSLSQFPLAGNEANLHAAVQCRGDPPEHRERVIFVIRVLKPTDHGRRCADPCQFRGRHCQFRGRLTHFASGLDALFNTESLQENALPMDGTYGPAARGGLVKTACLLAFGVPWMKEGPPVTVPSGS